MPEFTYRGRNARGEVLQGTIESASNRAVASWLLNAGVTPIAIEPVRPRGARPQWAQQLFGAAKVRREELAFFTRQMAALITAGLPTVRALQGIQRLSTSERLSSVLRSVCEDLDHGAELHRAMARHEEVFDEYFVSMVRVGESSGRLGEAFAALAEQIEFDVRMRKKIAAAVRYPSFIMIAVGVAIGVVTTFVIPVFAKTFESMHAQLPPLTRVLIGASDFISRNGVSLSLALVLSGYMVHLYLRTPDGRYRWDRAKLRIVVIGKIVSKGAMATFFRSFATANKSGLPILQTIGLVASVVGNRFLETRVRQMSVGVERGESLTMVARSAGIFSGLELQMLAMGEESGTIDAMMERVARMYQEEVEYEVSRLSETLEPLLLVVMGVLVGVLMLGVFLPLWQMGQAAFQRAH